MLGMWQVVCTLTALTDLNLKSNELTALTPLVGNLVELRSLDVRLATCRPCEGGDSSCRLSWFEWALLIPRAVRMQRKQAINPAKNRWKSLNAFGPAVHRQRAHFAPALSERFDSPAGGPNSCLCLKAALSSSFLLAAAQPIQQQAYCAAD